MLWENLEKNSVGLAPLAGITDSPFRQLCRKFGADFVMSEMISATGVCYDQKKSNRQKKEKWKTGSKSLELARFTDSERPIILQIFGNDPHYMATAAEIINQGFRPDGIDINMGCPVRKVMKNGSGVTLMDKPELAAAITKKVKKAIGKTPLSVKTRTGIKRPTILDLAPRLEQAGADALIIHGRLQMKMFHGPADLEMIRQIAEKIRIPVIANGGIHDADSHQKALRETGARATIIGQAALGNPFIFTQIKNPAQKITWQEKKKVILEHARLQIAYRRDEEFAMTEMRKHLAWYIKGFKNAARWRQKLVLVKSMTELKKILKDMTAECFTLD